MTIAARPNPSPEDPASSDVPRHTRPVPAHGFPPRERRRLRDDTDAMTHETVSGARLSISRLRSGTTVIALAGEIDLSSVETVERTVLDTVAASGGRLVVIDLNRVRFLGARGTAVLVAAGDRAARGGGVLRIVPDAAAPAAHVMRWVLDAGSVSATMTEALTARAG